MYEQELQNLGLSEKEAKVYTASLELGPETAQNIAKHASVNRATAYVQIDSLKEKGLMSEFEKGKKTFFVAESPNRLKNLLAVLEKELALKKQEAHGVIPGLLEMFESMGEKPRVRFLEGVEGAMTMRDEFLNVKDKIIYGIVDTDKLFSFYPEEWEDYSAIRAKKKIKTKTFYVSQEPIKGANSKQFLREAKYIDRKKLDLNMSITIYDNKVAFSTYSHDPISVIIESELISDSARNVFKLIWAGL